MQKVSITTLKADIDEAVGRAIEPLRKQQTDWFGKITQAAANDEPNPSKNQRGIGIGHVVKALYTHGPEAALAVCNKYNSTFTKANMAGDATGGGFLIQGQMANEVIDLLRARSVVRAINPRVIQATSGGMTFPRLDTGAVASYVAESTAIALSTPAFGQVKISMKKLAALVAMSNELLRFTGDGAAAVIRDDLVKALSTVEDQKFIRGDGTSNAPKGLRFWATSGNVQASAGTSAANIETDFKALINDLETNNVPMVRPAWLMNPRSKNHLLNLRDANGNLIFPELRTATPTLYSWPLFVTTNIPTNLGAGTNQTELYLVDADEVVIGEVAGIEIELSKEAAYTSGGSLVSSFTRDESIVRAILHNDLVVRHPESVAVVTAITWGA